MKSIGTLTRALAATTALAGAALPALTARAADIPWTGEEVDLVARNRPVADFLRDLFAAEGLSVSLASSIDGELNGEFAGEAGEVFDQVASVYGLVPYYDGSTVRIYAGADVETRMFSLSPELTAQVRLQLDRMNLGDRQNTARLTPDGVLRVSGVPAYVQEVEGLVTDASIKAQEAGGAMSFEVFPLRYAWAQDTSSRFGSTEVSVPGVASIVRNLVATGPAVPIQVRRGRAGPRDLPDVRGDYEDYQALGALDISAQRRGPFGVRPVQDDERTDQAGTVEIAPTLPAGVRVEADPRMNAVIVRDRPERMAIYRDLIERLDRQPQIVAIEATIIDVDTDRLRDIGVQWRFDSDDANVTLSGQSTAGLPLSPGDFLNPFRSGLLASGVVGNEDMLSARLSLLEAEGVARVVSSPQVMTLANVEAVFNNTQRFFVRVASQFDADLFDVTVGTSLAVTPHVVDEGGEKLIKLLVNVEDGQITGSSVDGIPVVENSAVGTQGIMRPGEALLLGGLTVDSSQSFEEGVPILKDIPLLGRAFRSSSDRKGRVERMFLLTPRLATPGGNLAVRLNDGPAAPPTRGQAPEVRPRGPATEVSLERVLPEPIEVAMTAEGPAPLPLLRGGQLFSSLCDDLDPFDPCQADQGADR